MLRKELILFLLVVVGGAIAGRRSDRRGGGGSLSALFRRNREDKGGPKSFGICEEDTDCQEGTFSCAGNEPNQKCVYNKVRDVPCIEGKCRNRKYRCNVETQICEPKSDRNCGRDCSVDTDCRILTSVERYCDQAERKCRWRFADCLPDGTCAQEGFECKEDRRLEAMKCIFEKEPRNNSNPDNSNPDNSNPGVDFVPLPPVPVEP